MRPKNPNIDFLLGLKTAGINQQIFAFLVGDPPSMVSEYVNGRRIPNERRRRLYSAILKREIFWEVHK